MCVFRQLRHNICIPYKDRSLFAIVVDIVTDSSYFSIQKLKASDFSFFLAVFCIAFYCLIFFLFFLHNTYLQYTLPLFHFTLFHFNSSQHYNCIYIFPIYYSAFTFPLYYYYFTTITTTYQLPIDPLSHILHTAGHTSRI